MILSRLAATSALALCLVLGWTTYAIGPAVAAESKGPTVRPEVGKPVQAAQALINQGKFKEALAQLAAADAVGGKTAYESYAIEATRESALLKSGDYAGAVKASDALIASGQLGPAEVTTQYSAQVKLDYQIKNYQGVIAAANKYYQGGGTDQSFHQLVAQSYYLTGDMANAAKTLKAMTATGKPEEDQLKLLMTIEYKSNPSGQGYIDSLEKLVQFYPSKNYWHDLILAIEKKPGFSDKLELDVAQLKMATGNADSADDYMNAAQLALENGFPGVANKILTKGQSAGVLGQGAQAARQKKFADMASSQAASDEKTLSQEAAQAHGGSALLKLGDSYASYGENDQAIGAYQKSIDAGGPTVALAKLHLGLAYIAAGQKAKAKDTLKSVSASDGTQDLAQLWILQAGL